MVLECSYHGLLIYIDTLFSLHYSFERDRTVNQSDFPGEYIIPGIKSFFFLYRARQTHFLGFEDTFFIQKITSQKFPQQTEVLIFIMFLLQHFLNLNVDFEVNLIEVSFLTADPDFFIIVI